MSLGFLGSFGHCVGMCGPITVAFSLSRSKASAHRSTHQCADSFDPLDPPNPLDQPNQPNQPNPSDRSATQQLLYFHGLLNLGRLMSYTLVGAGIGAVSSVLIAGGQMAGVGSFLRRAIGFGTGGLLIWLGLLQLAPGFLPKLPLLNPMGQVQLHDRLSRAMLKMSERPNPWTPLLLGLAWGLIPCGFLYTAQVKAAETGSLWSGAATLLAFGLGTLPMMLGVSLAAIRWSADRRSQLFQMGGWITLIIGILTLTRTGDTMNDYTGYGSVLLLMLALIARPLSRLWPQPLRYRRILGVTAFILALIHTGHTLVHTFNWQFATAFTFLTPSQQWSLRIGIAALLLMAPAACTSFDRLQRFLGNWWRSIHLLSVPALLLAVLHILLLGTSRLGGAVLSPTHPWVLLGLGVLTLSVLAIRSRWVWSLLSLEKFYAAPALSADSSRPSTPN